MTAGRIVIVAILAFTVLAGAAMYYLQVYAFYREIPAGEGQVTLVPQAGGAPEAIAVSDFRGIDSESSPIRYRACFEVADPSGLAGRYRRAAAPAPLTGPGWFECYNAGEIGEALEAGRATAYLSAPGVAEGVDRLVAVFPDGRGYAWHQLTEDY